jgi:hypothetical protein
MMCSSSGFSSEVLTHTLSSEYQGTDQQVKVILPDAYDAANQYRVLYVLSVEAGFNTAFGDALAIVEATNIHNTQNAILVQIGYEKAPWFGDHATDLSTRQESYFLHTVIPFIESTYSTFGTKEGRLLVGFSKSGWGAISLIFRNPEVFGYAAAWDSPMMLNTFAFNMEEIFGTQERLDAYRPDLLAVSHKAPFVARNRLVFSGESYFGNFDDTNPSGLSHTRDFHELLESQGIQHEFYNGLQSSHSWNSKWLAPVLDALFWLTHDADGDQLPDTWESQHGSSEILLDPKVDMDNDGQTNLEEYLQNTDPNTTSSYWPPSTLTPPDPESGSTGWILSWESRLNRIYKVFTTGSLTTGWQESPVHQIAGTGGLLTYNLPSDQDGPLFTRVSVEVDN